MVNDRGGIGRSIQLHCRQGLMISLDDSVDPHAVRVLPVPVERKLMGHFVTNFCPKAKGRKQLVSVGEVSITELFNRNYQ